MTAPFKLSKAGETLRLYDPSGVEIDSVSYPQLQDNEAYGRQTDGCGAFVRLEAPSPGRPNAALLPSGESPRTRCLPRNSEQEDTAGWRRLAQQSASPAQHAPPPSPPVPCASGADDCGCLYGVSGWSTSAGACVSGSSTSTVEAASCRGIATGSSDEPHATSTLPPGCMADVNLDGRVGVPDLLLVLSAFGTCTCGDECPADAYARFDLDGACSLSLSLSLSLCVCVCVYMSVR